MRWQWIKPHPVDRLSISLLIKKPGLLPDQGLDFRQYLVTLGQGSGIIDGFTLKCKSDFFLSSNVLRLLAFEPESEPHLFHEMVRPNGPPVILETIDDGNTVSFSPSYYFRPGDALLQGCVDLSLKLSPRFHFGQFKGCELAGFSHQTLG
jgi:hypothetical protein